jgi:hypothetical protein
MRGWGLFFFLLFLLVVIAYAGWIGWIRYTARRDGLPPPHWKSYIPFASAPIYRPTGYPAPRRGGIVGWFTDRIAGLKNGRTAPGAYEEPLGASAHARRGVDADEPWDTRIGNDSDTYGPAGLYEEQELDGPGTNERYDRVQNDAGRSGFSTVPRDNAPEDYGRSRYNGQRIGLVSKDTESNGLRDPFGDDAEHSELRDPDSQSSADMAGENQGIKHHADDSLTERRSIFRESL